MKKRILSVALTLCLCISSQSVAYAGQEAPSLQENALSEGSASESITRDSTIPTPAEVYQAMTALKDQDAYKEGTAWDDDTPYSDSKGYYHWKGGTLDGKNIVATGCVAFAFILSDAAFGNLPARMYAPGQFEYEDIKVGDILRVNTDTHTVIVLETSDVGVVIAEGNINTGNDKQGRIHWGRTMSKEEVMRDTSHYITRYPEGYIPPDDPAANESIDRGSLNGGLTWNLTKAGTLTISGKGAMPDYSSTSEQPWINYSEQIRKVVIENGVTSLGSCAFWNCGVLAAEIPDSVTAIGNSAFRGSSIVSVSIPSSVKTIGDSAFRECKGLSSVTISEGLETIEQNAFRSCTSLTSIALPASIGEIGAGAFFQCTAMTDATFASGSKQVKLGDNLFTGCYYLMNVTLPKSIDRIGEGMFQNCGMLAGLEIPQGAESIGGSAFASSGVSVVIIPDSVTTIGIAAFSNCPLKDIYFTGTEAQWKSISKIGDTAAAVSKASMHYNYTPADDSKPGTDNDNNSGNGGDNNTGDNSGNGGNGGNDDNSGNSGSDNSGNGDNSGSSDGSGNNSGNKPGSGDNSGNTPGSGDSSGDNSGNTPGSGDSSGDNSGNGGNDNNGNDDSSDNKPGNDDSSDNNTGNKPGSGDSPGNTPGSGDKPGSNQTPAPKPLPKGETFTDTKATYKVTKSTKEVELTTLKSTSKSKNVTINAVTGADGVKYKVTSIAPKAMQNNKKITNLTIGSNVKKIGANAFSGCTKLTTVALGKNVTTIEDNAFKGCTSLKNTLTLPNQVKTIGKNAFSGCSKLTTVTIGKTSKSNLTTIKAGSFKNCKNLKKVIIKTTKLKSVSKQAFKGTKSTLKVKVPSKQYANYKKLLKKPD